MNTTLKQTGQKWLNWASQHPKKFFIYSMVFLSVSFIGSLIQGIFFPSDNAFKINLRFCIPKVRWNKIPP
jgi:hypothetical protein